MNARLLFEQHRLKASNSGSRNVSVDFRNESLRPDSHHPKSCFLKVTTLVVTGIFLLLSAGATKVNATLIEDSGGNSGFVLDWVDEESGMAGGHYEAHDTLITPGSPGNHGHVAHWTWVEPTPPAALTTVKYYIHNHGGVNALSAAQIARIREAAAVWNTSGANVSLLEVGLDTSAEIHVHGTPISGLGLTSFSFFTNHNVNGLGSTGTGYTDGHPQHHMAGNVEAPFGFNNTRQVLSMDIRSDWYNGANAALIGGTQFDYMTVAIQEFGHFLGLMHPNVTAGHSAAEIALSPMNGFLPIGITRRVLQPGDITHITHLYGAIPEPPIIVPFDIKPGSDPNSVNLKSHGVLPMAVLSTDDFNVSDIDVDTLSFGDPLLIDGNVTAVSPLRYAFEDVSDDGLLDLTLKFSLPDLVDYDALGLDSIAGLLTGALLDGTLFEGLDSIRIVPPNGTNGASSNSLQVSAIPEPSALTLAAYALLGLVAYARPRRPSSKTQ